jgi:hypothetical protein
MTRWILWRSLTPAGWLLLCLSALTLLVIAARSVGMTWDPLGLSHRRLVRAETQAATNASDAAARALEVEGAAAQARRVDHYHQQRLELARVTERAAADARKAVDAQVPLDRERLARLRAHDVGLCENHPGLCRAPTTDIAPDGISPLPAGETAGGGDAFGS